MFSFPEGSENLTGERQVTTMSSCQDGDIPTLPWILTAEPNEGASSPPSTSRTIFFYHL